MSRLALLTLILVGCGTRPPATPVPDAGAADFAFDLYRRLEPNGSLVASPQSVAMALGMAHAGARGDTADAIAKVARLNAAPADVLSIPGVRWANSVWGRGPFAEPFVTTLRDRYAADAKQVALKGAEPAINAWASDRTGGRIPAVMPAGTLTDDTVLVLVNAVAFKGRWAHPFPDHRTRDKPFRAAGGKTPAVPMMHRDGKIGYARRDGAQAVELPFRDGPLSLLVLLPDAADGLKALTDGMTGAKLAAWVAALAPTTVELALPRFTVRGPALRLKTPLGDMGMAKAFSPDADFGGIAAGPLWINEVLHQAFIDVNEEGAEAAAVTAVEMKKEGPPTRPETVTFTADHPFLFVLRDRGTGAVLFVGRFLGP